MLEREILIANNRDQSQYRIITGAETLGELQDALAGNINVYKMVGGQWIPNTNTVDIAGLTFTEGITKSQLLTRDAQLPTNVMFKGQRTNNLVMLLTNTNKQIRSGANLDRKEAYRLIKELGLQEAIQEGEGKNYTQVKTDVLAQYIELATSKSADELEDTRKELNTLSEERPVSKLPDYKTAPHEAVVSWFYTGIKDMVTQSLLHTEDVVVLTNLLTELSFRLLEEKATVTNDDIDEMLMSIL